jgi:uncharacterized protein (TIGR02996 family)
LALFRSTSNRIEHIVARGAWYQGFETYTQRDVEALLLRLAQLSSVTLDHVASEAERRGNLIIEVRCRGRTETIRIAHDDVMFPPSVFIAYLNSKLAATNDENRLVACRDGREQVVALCDPDQQVELRECIFACMDDLRWPAETLGDTEIELLRAITESPDDDGPRLVYADWLTEQGDRRGEFITLQCHADPDVRERSLPILAVHEPTWTSHLPVWCQSPRFARGFVTRVSAQRHMADRFRTELLVISPIAPEVDPFYEDADV